MTVAATRLRTALLAAVATMLSLSACIVEGPTIETTGDQTNPPVPTQAPEPTVDTPQFEPTVPAEPTPQPTATATPTPTVPPTPPPPTGPTPLPTTAPDGDFATIAVEPGLVVIPVRGASFRLSASHPVLQLGGHTLIYVDDERNAEVDIFTPVGTRDAEPLADYAAVVSFITTDSAFASLTELTPVSIAGFATRVFEGPAATTERAFVTDLTQTGDEFGWLPPVRMRLWVIDHPEGPVVVSAESLENPGRYSEAVRLATEVLSTIDFG